MPWLGKNSVLLVDADPQGSALDWAAARRGEPMLAVAGLPRASIHKELSALAKDYDMVIIDGPPRVYDVARTAIMASDLVLIPVRPSPHDVWAAKKIVDLIVEARVYKPNLTAAFTINRKIVNMALGRDVTDALSDYPIPAADRDLPKSRTGRISGTRAGSVGDRARLHGS